MPKKTLIDDMQYNKSNRGGYREGSGRKSKGERKLVTVRLHEEHYKILVEESKAEGISQGKYVENLIELKQHGNNQGSVI